jgi:hypothetical protein
MKQIATTTPALHAVAHSIGTNSSNRRRQISSQAAKTAILVLVGIVLPSIPSVLAASRAQSPRVTFNIYPAVFRAGQPASAELSVASVSISPLSLSAGNTFSFFVDSAIGAVSSFSTPVSVSSASLSPGDFAVSFGASQNQLNITYTGQTKSLAYGDGFSVKVSFTAAAQPGTGKLSLLSQFVQIVNGDLPFTTASIVDFANSGTSAVIHDATLTGDGSGAMPLGIAPGGVGTIQLADSSVVERKIAPGAVGTVELAGQAVTGSKIAPGTVVRSLNGLSDNLTLAAGANISITPSGNTLTIAGASNTTVVYHAFNQRGPGAGFGALDGAGAVVISKDVPAGSYLIFFKSQMFNSTPGKQEGVTCILSTGDQSHIVIPQEGDADVAMIVLQDAATFATPTTISVTCGGTGMFASNNVLTAIKIASIF